MPRDLAWTHRVDPTKIFPLPIECFPPPRRVLTQPVRQAAHMRPRDFVFWLQLGGQSRCYPWWILDNFHMVNDNLRGAPILVGF